MKKFSDLRQTDRKNLKDVIPLKKPYAITIDPCSICNFHCKQCKQSEQNPSFFRGMMSFSDFKKIVDDLKMWEGPEIKTIKLYNCGEPLLNPEFPKMLRYLYEANVTERIDLTTNAVFLTHDVSKELINGGLDYLRVSIYSPLQEKNERITSSQVDVENIVQNVAYLHEMRNQTDRKKPFIAVKMFETEDLLEKEAFLQKFERFADEIFFEKKHDFSGNGRHRDSLLPSEKMVCPWPFYSLTIQSDGTVDCCCVDWENRTAVGNALNEKIEDVWNGKKMNEFRRKQLSKERKTMESCRSCSVYLTNSFTVDNIDEISLDEYHERMQRV